MIKYWYYHNTLITAPACLPPSCSSPSLGVSQISPLESGICLFRSGRIRTQTRQLVLHLTAAAAASSHSMVLQQSPRSRWIMFTHQLPEERRLADDSHERAVHSHNVRITELERQRAQLARENEQLIIEKEQLAPERS